MPTNNAKLNNTVMVYVTTFDIDVEVGEVKPSVRNGQIQRCTDVVAKLQRYCVWKLLDYALHDCYCGGVADFDLYVDGNGKWNSHNGVEFSLSHSNNVVAVAVCNHFVGVDVEAVARFANHVDDGFATRILTDSEQLVLRDTPAELKAEALAEMWTKKESIFKLQSRSSFRPKSFDTTKMPTHFQFLTVNGEKYALSVARYIPSKIELVQPDWKDILQQ